MSSQLEILSNNFNQLISDYQNTYTHYTNSLESDSDSIFYSNKLKELNLQLMEINQQMSNLTNEKYRKYKQNTEKQQEQEEILTNNYNILAKERNEIEMMLRQYSTLNSAYKDETEIVTSNYLNYIILLFVAIILILLFLNFTLSGEQRGGGGRQFSLAKIGLILFFTFIFIYILIILIHFY